MVWRRIILELLSCTKEIYIKTRVIKMMEKYMHVYFMAIVLAQVQNSKSAGDIEIQIEYVKNHNGLLKNGRCCEGFRKENLECTGTCLTFVTFCISNINTNDKCDIGYAETPTVQRNEFAFLMNKDFKKLLLTEDFRNTSDLINTSDVINSSIFKNDLSFKLPNVIPGSNLFMISVEVRHRASKNNTALIKDFRTNFSFTPHDKWIFVRQAVIGFHVRVACKLSKSINVTFWCDNPGNYHGYNENGMKLCNKGWKGENCDQDSPTCLPKDNDEGHYDCENDKKICHPGWTGDFCQISTYKKLCKPRDDHTGHYGCSFEGEQVCNVGWEGENCLQNIDDCLSNPCFNNGSCVDMHSNFECLCPGTYGGKQCEIDFGNEPCKNNGIMLADNTCRCPYGYKGNKCEVCITDPMCVDHGTCKYRPNSCDGDCIPGGWVGQLCEIEQDSCSHNRSKKFCSKNGVCITGKKSLVSGQSWECLCHSGWTGRHCEIKIHVCENRSPCQNGGTCLRTGKHFNDDQTYECKCPLGFSGKDCQNNINDCSSNKNASLCLNNGKCVDQINNYTCSCPLKFEGRHCEKIKNACKSNPCSLTSTCENLFYDYHCHCYPGYKGRHCNETEDCTWRCRNNASCVMTFNGTQSYECICSPGTLGKHCELNKDYCISSPCVHGICVNQRNEFYCVCETGYSGKTCAEKINYCNTSSCKNNGLCINLDSSFFCKCPSGWSGKTCEEKNSIGSDCNKCQHSTDCVITNQTTSCKCEPGYTGIYCEKNVDDCINVTCNHGTCIDRVNSKDCVCHFGYTGKNCSINIDDCASYPCKNDGVCIDNVASFTCNCPRGFDGYDCSHSIDDCSEVVCENGGTCIDGHDSYECICRKGYNGRHCEISSSCSPALCKGKAKCIQVGSEAMCVCPTGFVGELCDQPNDNCVESRCENGGACVNKESESACICQPGFYGRNCEWLNSCTRYQPCENGAECLVNGNDFICICKSGYYGKKCDQIQDACFLLDTKNKSDTFNHLVPSGVCNKRGGKCISLPHGNFKCQCDLGWTGERCQIDIDNCAYTYCSNGGQCIDLEDDFRCECPPGFTGTFCQININDCLGSPCQNKGVCQDLVNDFICECQDGWKGKTCTSRSNPCSLSTCQNAGSCRAKGDKFACICAAGFQGPTCAEKKNKCTPAICNKHGDCNEVGDTLVCNCKPGYFGQYCEKELNECESNPCLHGAQCVDGINWYHCQCPPGYYGVNCQLIFNECIPNPCVAPYKCISLASDYKCICPEGRTGEGCLNYTKYKNCKYKNVSYIHNETWEDSCNICRCDDGALICTKTWCGVPNCFNKHESPNCMCKVQKDAYCITPPCLPWGECSVQTVPVLYSLCSTSKLNVELTEDCSKIMFFFNASMLPKGILLEELCQELRFLKMIRTFAISTEVRLWCSHSRFNASLEQITVEIYSKKTATQLSLEIAKYKLSLVEQYTKEMFKLTEPSILMLFFRSVVFINIERPSNTYSFLKEAGYFIPLMGTLVMCVILLFLCVCLWTQRKRKMRHKEDYLSDTRTCRTNNKLKESPRVTPCNFKKRALNTFLEYNEISSPATRRKLVEINENILESKFEKETENPLISESHKVTVNIMFNKNWSF